jgi:hypothetical protein
MLETATANKPGGSRLDFSRALPDNKLDLNQTGEKLIELSFWKKE